ncbi:MAG: DUF6141 family protein [Planctomycetota bacterium]|jgi:hypothetical protein
MNEKSNVIYKEVQKFSLILRLLIVCAMALAIVFDGLALHKMLSEQTSSMLSISMLIIFGILIPIAIPTLFMILKLETVVRSDGLYVRFFPLHLHFKKFTFDDISDYFVRIYKPLLEYGGWGIRCGFGKSGKAYNVKGNKGLQLVFKNDKRLLIGSQKPERLLEAMNSIRQKNE